MAACTYKRTVNWIHRDSLSRVEIKIKRHVSLFWLQCCFLWIWHNWFEGQDLCEGVTYRKKHSKTRIIKKITAHVFFLLSPSPVFLLIILTFPLVQGLVCVVERVVVRLCFRLLLRFSELSEVRHNESLCGRYPSLRIQQQHALQHRHGWGRSGKLNHSLSVKVKMDEIKMLSTSYLAD